VTSLISSGRSDANAQAIEQLKSASAKDLENIKNANAQAIEQLKSTSDKDLENIKNANAQAIEQLKIDYDKLKVAAQREKEISKFSEPLARAAYDLQSRFYNILQLELIDMFLVRGDDREKAYVVNNTAFLIGQYLCWTEMVRREIQYIDLGSN